MNTKRDARNFVMHASRCRGKHHFSTKQLAKHAARLNSRLHGYAIRIYKCPVCEGYHLTSDTERRPVWAR